LRIALITYRYSEHGGGVEGYVSRLTKGLLDRGHEVHVFSHRIDSPPPVDATLHRVPAASFYSALGVLGFAYNSAAMLRQDNGYDIINGFGRCFYQDVFRVGGGVHREYLLQTKASMHNPFLRTLHRLNPVNMAVNHVEEKTFSPSRYRRIICNSKTGKSEIMRYYQVPEDKVRVVYNNVDSDRFTPDIRSKWREEYRQQCGAGEDELLALFVGHGTRRKGIDTALKVVERVCRNLPLRLAVVGRCDGRYMSQAKRSNLPVEFLGAQQNVERFYAAADFMLFPTRYEGFSNACMETMASGVPLITTNRSGVHEIIDDGNDGLVVENYESVDDFVEKVQLLENGERRRQMGEAARAKVSTFTAGRNLDETESVYREILKEKED